MGWINTWEDDDDDDDDADDDNFATTEFGERNFEALLNLLLEQERQSLMMRFCLLSAAIEPNPLVVLTPQLHMT
eukprot:647789-Amphidinium_carterae.1